MRTYAGIALRLGLAERDVRRVAEELELCGYRLARPVRLGKRDVLAIRARADGGETVKSIADSTGLAFTQVRRIVEREIWQGAEYEPESAGPFITAGRPV